MACLINLQILVSDSSYSLLAWPRPTKAKDKARVPPTRVTHGAGVAKYSKELLRARWVFGVSHSCVVDQNLTST